MSRVAAIDYGLKRTGLALSDPSRILASPLTTLKTAPSLAKTAQLILDALPDDVSTILVGHPLHLDGRPSPMAKKAARLAEALRELTSIPVHLFDERLSTAQADRLMRESGINRKRRAAVADELAATIVLQAYLDSGRS